MLDTGFRRYGFYDLREGSVVKDDKGGFWIQAMPVKLVEKV